MEKKNNTLVLTQFAALLAIEAIFCFTPLGALPAFGPIVATLAMIPVLITALVLGPKAGTLMGFMAGLFSFLVWTFTPPSPVMAFIFTPFTSLAGFSGNFGSLIICFVPRFLSGTVAGLLRPLLTSALQGRGRTAMAIASAAGSMVNTLGVMLGIWLFFGAEYSSLAGAALPVLIGSTILTSGIPEALVAALICPAVSGPLLRVTGQTR